MNSLIALVSTQGVPERGYISSRLANASPFTHPSLYKDDTSQPTVFAAWTRIMLTLMKFELAILLRKPFLGPPDSENPQSHKSWTRYETFFLSSSSLFPPHIALLVYVCSAARAGPGYILITVHFHLVVATSLLTSDRIYSIVQLCVNYLRIYLQLHQTPAFAPYTWFCCSHYGPSQCVFITLMYLHSFPDAGEIFLARHLVDEFIHHCAAHHQISDPWSTSSTRNNSEEPESNGVKMRMPLAIQVLVELHDRLYSSRGPQERPLSQPDTIECSYRFPASHLATKATSDLRVTPNQTSAETSSSANRTNHNCETPPIVTGPPPSSGCGQQTRAAE